MRFDDLTSSHSAHESTESGLVDGMLPSEPERVPRRTRRGAELRAAQLVRAIEAEIVPRLVMARGTAPRRAKAASGSDAVSIGVEDVDQLVRVLLANEASVAADYVGALAQRGIPLDALCLQLLAPAARRLGELWDEDLGDFTEVTVGLCRLQSVLRELSPELRADSHEQGPSILLVPSPGEQHMFGVLMVAEFFRREGWIVCSEFPRSHTELIELIARQDFDLVGLSVTREELLDGLPERIAVLRQASRNPELCVLLGGRVFVDRPERAAVFGADAVATGCSQALELASQLRKVPIHAG